MWKSSIQTRAELSAYDSDTLDYIEDLFGITDIIDSALPRPGFTAPVGFRDVIVPSASGEELILLLEERIGVQNPDDISLALLLKLFHHDILIDPKLSDPAKAWALLSTEIAQGNLVLPYRLGRSIYDKFNVGDVERTEHLIPSRVDELLYGAETGIYQVGRFITGPLGVVKSLEKRYLPAVRSLPLWHCADTGCRTTHHVELLVHDNTVEDILDSLNEIAKSQRGPASDWGGALIDLHRRDVPSRGRDYSNIPAILSDCIPREERDYIVARALKGPQGEMLRRCISEAKPDLRHSRSDDLAAKLSDGCQIQALLILADKDLVDIIDAAIWAREIKIPPTEVRKPKEAPPRVSVYDSTASLSMFGIRTEQRDPSLFLADLIWREYERVDQLSELAWRCLKGSAVPNHSVVLEFMKIRGARDAVSTLILPSRPIALAVADRLHCHIAPGEAEDEVVNRILWKCGFDVPRFDSVHNRLPAQLKLLREEVVRYRPRLNEDDRDAIRSKGVNVFVSLEKVIEEIVSYNIWVLSSDHFVVTNFEYRPDFAIGCVSRVLGDYIESSGQRFTWNKNGGNVLGVLLLYARAAANWMLSLSTQDRSRLARSSDEVPHFATEGREVRRFGFWHHQLWADADQNELSDFAREFDNLIGQLEQSRLAEVRNGLDHYRDQDRFPPTDLIISCESRISSALQFADVNRFIPNLFWLHRLEIDDFGMSKATFVEASGRQLVTGRPGPISGSRGVAFARPTVIPFGNLLGSANSDLLFRMVEDSRYSRLWEHYPRRAPQSGNQGSMNSTPGERDPAEKIEVEVQ